MFPARIPVSRMRAMVEWQMSETPTEDLDVLESAYEVTEAEVLGSLETTVQNTIELLERLHLEVKSVTPKADMLVVSSAIVNEEMDKVNAVLTRATENLQAQRAHNQRLQNKLHRLERRVQEPSAVNVFIREAKIRVASTLR